MILPQKHVKLSESLFGLGSFLIQFIQKPISIDDLWNEFNKINNTEKFPTYHSFDNFILALDYLYLIGAIDQDDKGGIVRCD
ncbi:hypothetical protein bcgnr5369_54220 [Bacillus cereus]|uniref:ABC-three component system middle component 6 n=1 Tax=Bacillus cereus TaxID=1396 RepID=UPI002AC22D49|nr:ABC-three component system middle component 6 [Bacillus cereus]MDZ4594080.1 hypothetical protein [Bacillus cereus]HDR7771503.1 hypothetical protein [Bacillus paranthracis]